MKNASELLKAYLDNVQNARVAAGLFAEDGAIELPYLQTLGYPWRAEGPEEIGKFLENILSLFADFKFHSVKIFIEQPGQVFGEYEVTTTVKETGNVMHQLYMGRLVAENGKIKLLREALDTVVTERAFSPKL
ncbi:MAG TPA: nuclear transport factor 2 family protein [Chryseolinea sp.]